MARCPFAVWTPITGPSGPHVGGPFKIIHHTTEGSSAQGAFDAFRANRSDPHFTVDPTTIYQHVDTSMGARALRNEPGGVQTNRDGAIQIRFNSIGPPAGRSRRATAAIRAATIAIPRFGMLGAGTTDTAMSRRTRTGIRATRRMKRRS
jgi:hypothetical protein